MTGPVYQFEDFRLDCGRFELTRNGRSIPVERKPMELLILLAERNGQLLTRAEIVERLWGKDVFVDTEHGVNTAIRKIRYTLRDDAEEPRFIETVMGKGYRFVAPVIVQGGADHETIPSDTDTGLPDSRRALGEPKPISTKPPSEGVINQPRWRWLAWAVPVLLVLAAAAGFAGRSWMHKRALTASIRSLAVIPLDNLSGDPGQEYFADGMTDELITMLAKDSTLRITSRTSVMQYKGARRPLSEIARSLGVDAILEGSVERSGDKVHMNLQLIRAGSDTHLWAESYDRSLNDLSRLPGEAAQQIAKQLQHSVIAAAPARYVNPKAHDAYLHGRYLWFAGNFPEAHRYFLEATELQPDYAPGWSGLAIYYAALAATGSDPRPLLPALQVAAAKALQLDPSLPEAHLAMSVALAFVSWDLAGADQEILRAIDLDSQYAEAYHLRAKMLCMVNRGPEAIEVQKRATEIDPVDQQWKLIMIDIAAREYDAAIENARLQMKSPLLGEAALGFLSQAYGGKGMYAESNEWHVKELIAGGDSKSASEVRRAFQRGGYKAVAQMQLSSTEKYAKTHYVPPFYLALPHAQLGHREQTLAFLEEAFAQHSTLLLEIHEYPQFDFLRSDSRYRALVQKIGLPPAY